MPENTTTHPDQIGPYRVIQVIGEGGMGVVYEAEQREPVRRRVAVKMMKAGMDTAEVVGRFEAERQALAVMEHPGIATVLDAGVSDKGRPYFVMELVRGMRLDDYCDQERLSVKQRIELFMEVCEAVQHAHQKGVIHRDLKPSNVLIREEAGRPHPTVIDFGIAKATGQSLSHQTVVTTLGQAIGTLAYMSPEQADVSGLDVDTRSDVYALGVILYELLMGSVPLDPEQLGGILFLSHLIERDQPVPTPSGHFTGLDQSRQGRVAELRRTDIERLKKELGGDLQWIAMKAMDKDRNRRYATASELAMDLRNYLEDQVVSARPPSPTYRVGKFVRRNRLPVLMASGLMVAVSMGLVGTTLGLVRARAAENQAERQTVTANLALEFMIGMFGGSDPTQGGSAEMTAREVLDANVSRIDTLASQPLVQARLLQAMGAVYTSLGLYDRADTLLQRSLAVRRETVGEADEALERSLRQLAWLYMNEGRLTDALPLAEESWRIADLAYPLDSPMLADAAQVIGMVQRDLGRYDEAATHLNRSLEIREAVFGPDHIQTGFSLYHLAWLENLRDDRDAARTTYQRLLPIYEAEYGPDNVLTASLLNDYAVVLSRSDAALDSALALHRRVLDIRVAAYGSEHAIVGRTLINIGATLHNRSDLEGAAQHYRRAIAVFEEAYEGDNLDIARAYYNVAEISRDTGDLVAGEAAYRRALEGLEASVGRQHSLYEAALRGLARVLVLTGRVEEGDRLTAQADSIPS